MDFLDSPVRIMKLTRLYKIHQIIYFSEYFLVSVATVFRFVSVAFFLRGVCVHFLFYVCSINVSFPPDNYCTKTALFPLFSLCYFYVKSRYFYGFE